MFSLSGRVFVWFVLAVSASTAVLWLPGHRDCVLQQQYSRCLIRTGCYRETGVLQGLDREFLFPHWGSPFFPHLVLGLAEILPCVPLSPALHLQQKQYSCLFPSCVPSLLGKGSQLQKKGGGGKENKCCRAGTQMGSPTLVRRVPRAEGRTQWL